MKLNAFIAFVGILVSIPCCLAANKSIATSKPAGSNHTTQMPTPKQTTSFKQKTAKVSVPTTPDSGKEPKSAATTPKPTQASKHTTIKIKPAPKSHKNTGKTPKPSLKTTSKSLPKTSSKPLSNTTSKPEIPCKSRNESCSKCLEGHDCFYCSSDKSCRKKDGILPTGCKGNKWYWKQCNFLGNILIIVIPTVGGVLLIMLGCCIYCCCCRRCGKNSVAREERRQQQRRVDRQERNTDRKQSRKARHDAIRMKYGLLQNMDDDDPLA